MSLKDSLRQVLTEEEAQKLQRQEEQAAANQIQATQTRLLLDELNRAGRENMPKVRKIVTDELKPALEDLNHEFLQDKAAITIREYDSHTQITALWDVKRHLWATGNFINPNASSDKELEEYETGNRLEISIYVPTAALTVKLGETLYKPGNAIEVSANILDDDQWQLKLAQLLLTELRKSGTEDKTSYSINLSNPAKNQPPVVRY